MRFYGSFSFRRASKSYGWTLVFLSVIATLAALYILPPAAEQAADAVTPAPPVPELLADHQERGPGLERGNTVGAASIYPRPEALFKADRTDYEFALTPNRSSRGQVVPEAITIHVTGPGTMNGMKAWFQNAAAQASAHFGVGKDGSIDQYADLADATWHNGILNRPNLSNSMIAGWVTSRINPNVKTVGIEVLLSPGEDISEYPKQKQSLYRLLDWLMTTLKIPADRTHVIGHYEIDSVNRSVDPRCCIDLNTVVQDLVAIRSGGGVGAGGLGVGNFERWGGDAAPDYFYDRQVNGAQQVYARYDYALPVDVQRIDVEVFLKSGSLTIYDGAEYSGRACYISAGVNRCSVFLDPGAEGIFTLYGQAQIDKLAIIGLYR